MKGEINDGVVERPPESGDTFKEGVFIFLGCFSLGSDSQAQSEENRRNLIGEEISLNSMSARENRARKRGGSIRETGQSLYFIPKK